MFFEEILVIMENKWLCGSQKVWWRQPLYIFFSRPDWLPSVGVKKGTIRGEAGVTYKWLPVVCWSCHRLTQRVFGEVQISLKFLRQIGEKSLVRVCIS